MMTGDLGISKAGGATITRASSAAGLGNTMMMAGLVAVISIPIVHLAGFVGCDAPRYLA